MLLYTVLKLSLIHIYVLRDGKEVEVTAVRDKIEVQTVAYEMKEDQIGYIAVSEFDSVTSVAYTHLFRRQ